MTLFARRAIVGLMLDVNFETWILNTTNDIQSDSHFIIHLVYTDSW